MIQYKILYEICCLLNSETDFDTLIRLTIDKVIETTSAQRGLLVLKDENGGLIFECVRDRNRQDVDQPSSEASTTFIRQVFDSAKTLVLENALTDPSLDTSASIRSLKILSLAGAPVKINNEIFGVICIDSRSIAALFNDNTRLLLDELAALISVPIRNSLERRFLLHDQQRLRQELQHERGAQKIIGDCPLMLKLFEQLAKIAPTDAPVLITGETGTGKELIAREIHACSLRKDKDLVTLNCSAIPENLLESELFGYEKGAFTGADRDKPGWFELADRSTIFLDEIGELSQATQAKLLRVIQFGESTPVGSKRTNKIDVRLIAATNRDLPAMVRDGSFRKDLYFRLNVFQLPLPPLRERGSDIIAIAEHFLERAAIKANRRSIGLSADASKLLLDYPFPGNVRELENIIQRAIFFSKTGQIEAEDLQLLNIDEGGASVPARIATDFKTAKSTLLAQFEKEFLTSHLSQTNGNISLAAKNAGMYKKNFIDKMKRYDIHAEQFKL